MRLLFVGCCLCERACAVRCVCVCVCGERFFFLCDGDATPSDRSRAGRSVFEDEESACASVPGVEDIPPSLDEQASSPSSMPASSSCICAKRAIMRCVVCIISIKAAFVILSVMLKRCDMFSHTDISFRGMLRFHQRKKHQRQIAIYIRRL